MNYKLVALVASMVAGILLLAQCSQESKKVEPIKAPAIAEKVASKYPMAYTTWCVDGQEFYELAASTNGAVYLQHFKNGPRGLETVPCATK